MSYIKELLQHFNMSEQTTTIIAYIIMVLFITIVCILANLIAKKVILKFIVHVLKNNKYTWDDVLVEKRVFHKLSHIVPAIIIYSFAPTFITYQHIIEKVAVTYIVIVTLSVIRSLLNAIDDIYRTYDISKVKPISGYITVVKIIAYVFGTIGLISYLIGQNPIYILGGLGALSAVIVLIFKDSILGLVAGIQLSSNDMIRVGDWIEMPKYNANGDIIDVSLHTVKVMNFDKSITMIPSYALISDSFRNWRGMQNAGGRRIKRAIFLDTSSIQFCTNEMLEQFKSIHLIAEYVTNRADEIKQFNNIKGFDTTNKVNGRNLTNIGVFRVYIEHYLRQHKGIHQELPLIVRQLESGDSGLPLEIYAFTNTVIWREYEGIQSDIFDHIFAIAPSFNLRIFQHPTGHDLSQATKLKQYAVEV